MSYQSIGVDNLAAVGGTGTISVESGTTLYAPGHVIQVVQAVKADTWSAAPGANQFIEIPGYSALITPRSINSKIIVNIDLYLGMSSYNSEIRIMRNYSGLPSTTTQSVPVWLFGGNGGAPVGSRPSMTFYSNYYPSAAPTYICARTGGQFVDSPNTLSPCMYSVQVKDYTTATIYVNRSNQFLDTADRDGCGISTITLMEVAQ